MTDTPATIAVPPLTRLEQVKAFLGDLARPFVLASTGCACVAATLMGGVGADKLTIAYGALTLMFGAKAVEGAVAARANAQVAAAQAQGGATP